MAIKMRLNLENPDHHGMIDIRAAWSDVFSMATSQWRKRHLISALRIEVDRVTKNDSLFNAAVSQERESAAELKLLQRGTVVGIVMPGGFSSGRRAYAMLNWMGISERFVMIGYPSIGSSGRVIIPESDVLALRENMNAPMLLVDHRVGAGATIAAIGRALREGVGHVGDMYQSTGSIAALEAHSGMARTLPVFTEHQMPLIVMHRRKTIG